MLNYRQESTNIKRVDITSSPAPQHPKGLVPAALGLLQHGGRSMRTSSQRPLWCCLVPLIWKYSFLTLIVCLTFTRSSRFCSALNLSESFPYHFQAKLTGSSQGATSCLAKVPAASSSNLWACPNSKSPFPKKSW